MVPRVGKPGRSFQGAGLYFLHDKEADTAERVAFAQTHNLPTDDPHAAMDWMAWTAMHQGEIKDASGVKRTGGDCARPVFHYSLAWHPDETPDESHMLGCARDTLELLGLVEHEAVFVAHQDQAHAHVHVIANLVNPQSGRTHDPGLYKAKLSEWAETYELAHGVHCDQRLENNQARREGAAVRYEEPALKNKETLQELYALCDGFEAFQGALEHAGYQIARGDRRGVVLIDPDGEVSSLSRQLDKTQRVQLRAQIKDVDLAELPGAEEAQARARQARAEQEAGQDQSGDAGRDDDAEGEGDAGRGRPRPGDPPAPSEPPDAAEEDAAALRLAALQDRQLDELGALYARLHAHRTQMAENLAHRFDAPLAQQQTRAAELEAALARSTGLRGFWRGLTGQSRRDAAELDEVRTRVRFMEETREASHRAFEERRQVELSAAEARHAQERAMLLQPAQEPSQDDAQAMGRRAPRQEDDGPSQSL